MNQPLTIPEARAYIAKVRWQFAKTMPTIPHWYTVRVWNPQFDQEFENLVRLIRSQGVRIPWPDPPAAPLYHNQYLLLDGWKYWTMGDTDPNQPPKETPATTGLINRAWIDIDPNLIPAPPARFYPL